jgi:KaiC/GvpD/RAD55 family RecA-like ATPase
MDRIEIRKFYEVIKGNEDIVEIRGLDTKGKPYSGYFNDPFTLVEEVAKHDNLNLYFTLNKVDEACMSRTQANKIVYGSKAQTSDVDIIRREWILIDLDPKRPADTNATEQEKRLAQEVGNRIYAYLRDIGFAYPVVADSSNGYHFLYRVSLKNTEENKVLIKDFLNAISLMFSTDEVEVDTSVFNASRICKLYGTVSRKGSNTKARPQRQSKILKVPEEIKETPSILIRKVADTIPKPEKPSYHNNYEPRFDIDEFISKNGIAVEKEVMVVGAKKILLKECPFDSNHKSPDSAIFVLNNGAIGFKCFHNSCSNRTWRDVRQLYEPTRENWRSTQPTHQKPQVVKEDGRGKKFLNLCDIEAIDRSKLVTIPSGIIDLDRRIVGFNCGEVSLWTGNNASGKSSLLGQVALNSVQRGFPAVLYSGELKANRVKLWIQQQAAGRQYVSKSNFGDSYYVPKQYVEWIDEWSKEKLKVYNNDYGNKILPMLEDMKEVVGKGAKTIILDNLMSLDILELEGDKYAKQTGLILKITDFAKENDVHIHLVAHPRKSSTFLRKTDVSGTADLTNAVDNVFIIHRVNNDFRLHAGEFLGQAVAGDMFKFGNVIEVCKNRDLGIQDFLVGLYFEIESRRFLNMPYENLVYDWMPQQTELDYLPSSENFNNFDDFDDLPI